MSISVGASLPDAEVLVVGPEGHESAQIAARFAGRKVALFGLPGAFTGVCSEAHMPSFVRTAAAFRDKGVDEIICVTVNDPFVVGAWDKAMGATDAGITLVADPAANFIKAIGMNWSAPPVGFFDRSKRFSLYADDGAVKALNVEDSPGECAISAGEALLEQI